MSNASIPQRFMEMAIEQAQECNPDDPDRTPKVGAVVVGRDGTLLAKGCRQVDTHAEKFTLDRILDKTRLAGATVYTTLEPCTPAVRSKPEESCTKLLLDAHVAKVVIGILDPNQQVCGKGVLELQEHGIEVELFPHELALNIRRLNERFIRAQRTLGVRFTSPEPGAKLPTNQTGGRHTFRCTCVNEPGADIFVLLERHGLWWVQADRLRHVQNEEYEFFCGFGSLGTHTVHIVRANELGAALLSYYRGIVDRNRQLRQEFKAKDLTEAVSILEKAGEYPGIPMPKLPRGLDSQGSITVEIVSEPAKA